MNDLIFLWHSIVLKIRSRKEEKEGSREKQGGKRKRRGGQEEKRKWRKENSLFTLLIHACSSCSVNVCGRTHEYLLSLNKVLQDWIRIWRWWQMVFSLAEQVPFFPPWVVCSLLNDVSLDTISSFLAQVPFLSSHYLSRTVSDTWFFSNQFRNTG